MIIVKPDNPCFIIENFIDEMRDSLLELKPKTRKECARYSKLIAKYLHDYIFDFLNMEFENNNKK